MKKESVSFLLAAAVLSVSIIFTGCSNQGEQQAEEKGGIEKMTDDAAEKAVRKIRTPKDKARAARDLGDDRLDAMDKAVQEQ